MYMHISILGSLSSDNQLLWQMLDVPSVSNPGAALCRRHCHVRGTYESKPSVSCTVGVE